MGELRREKKLEDGLTIVIPNWNHQPYLPRSIRSALQGLKRLEEDGYSGEIIVIDDASRDGSQKLLRSIQMLYGEPTAEDPVLATKPRAAKGPKSGPADVEIPLRVPDGRGQ